MRLKTMKLLKDITVEDLVNNYVWKYYSDNDDDDTSMVESSEMLSLTESDNEVYIALTQFYTSDGTTYMGYCSPTDSSGLDYIQPVIIYERNHIALWDGLTANEIGNILRKKVTDIFPIRYECKVPVDGKQLVSIITINELKNA